MATALLFLFILAITTTTTSCDQEMEILQIVQNHVTHFKNWAENSVSLQGLSEQTINVPIRDCAKLYKESESRLSFMISDDKSANTNQDMLTWVSAVMTNHRTCLDGLQEKGYLIGVESLNKNLTALLREALVLYSKNKGKAKGQAGERVSEAEGDGAGLLASWSTSTSKADFTVAQDGSGTHKTIKEAVDALAAMDQNNRPQRAVIYIKTGVYNEKVEVGYNLKNVMFVGDGIDNTVVTGNKNVIDGYTTLSSATFDVSGDGFWARDMTFENTAGPEKHQAVAMKVSSDRSLFYRCSFKSYQDTLFVHSNRQFYRDCDIYGTIDFIFGDASASFQNCNILVRKPMDHQSNFITAQGRDDPNKPTGISIQSCMVKAAPDFASSKGDFKSYLGRPWKEYSRVVFMKSDLDGLVDPKGWGEWDGDFAIGSLYYGEYMNSGSGASTGDRVKWPGFHLMTSDDEAMPFTLDQFLQGDQWIPTSGVPFSSSI